jgi:chromosome segregation ATPase
MATQVTTTNEIEQDRLPTLSEWLDDLPKSLLRGFDRKATRQLVERLDQICSDLIAERERLVGELSRLQELCEGLEQHEQELTAQVEGLSSELESTQQERQSLADQLRCARSRWDAELERARAELKRDLEQAEAELDGYRRREALLDEVAASARARANAIVAEARDEAERLLRHAHRRDQETLINAQREVDRLERERLRLQSLAADFRHALAARLTATLEELVRPERGEEAADRTAQPGEAGTARPDLADTA